MKGAIFFSSKYGSTAQYADWIDEATGLPVVNINNHKANLSKYDFLILGSPIIYYKLSIHKWVKRHLVWLAHKPIIFFSVSAAPAGSRLDGWIADSLPEDFISRMYHVALRGRQIPKQLSWYDWTMLKIAALANKDPEARKQEFEGFDFMVKTSIEPILKLVEEFQRNKVVA